LRGLKNLTIKGWFAARPEASKGKVR
jgi:hypothetical protein